MELGLSFGQHVSQAKIPADLLNPIEKSARPLLRLSVGGTKIERENIRVSSMTGCSSQKPFSQLSIRILSAPLIL